MHTRALKSCKNSVQRLLATLFVLVLMPGDALLNAWPPQQEQQQQGSPQPAAEKLSAEQLDSLVAPIALYPDPLLSQTLVASTYPLEIIQLQQWLEKHKDLKEKALAEAVQKQDWDPSVQAMASLPDVVKQLADNIKWTTDLGNAFLAQQSEVMEAVQRMRAKAKDAGNLKSSDQQKVETKKVEDKTVIVVEQANPQVVYVPSYNPVVVYGPPVYPYPPIAYPPAGYYAAGVAISFGVGVAMGAAWGGGWGYGAGWGHNDVNVNVNNNYVRNSNRQNANNLNRTTRGNNTWQHNPQHRGGAPYSNQRVANQYGGTARGDSMATRQANAQSRQASGTSRAMGTPSGNANRASERQTGGGADRAASRGSAGAGTGGGGDRVGNRSVPSTPSARSTSAFSGGAGGMSGSGARASSSRGASSMGRGGGGGRRR